MQEFIQGKSQRLTISYHFDWTSPAFITLLQGPLCGDPMRGVHFRLEDASIQSSLGVRKGGQLIPTTRRACYGAFLTAQPRIMEPVYLVEIQVIVYVSGHETVAVLLPGFAINW